MSNNHERIKYPNTVAVLINNLCNLTCNHCSGLFRYDFTGVFDWKTHEEKYKKWSEIVDFPALDIFGGEPYLNPDLDSWVMNIRKLWPDSQMRIFTNGTRLYSERDIELTRKFIRNNVELRVSCHDQNEWERTKAAVSNILKPWEDLKIIEMDMQPGKEWYCVEYYFEGRLLITLYRVTEMFPTWATFRDGKIHFIKGGDQEESFKKCVWKDESATLQHGLLYKCPPVTNYAEAKYQVMFDEEAAELLEQYKACSPVKEEVIDFINNIPKSMPQCSLCAYDKQQDTLTLSRPVKLDPQLKKLWRGLNSR